MNFSQSVSLISFDRAELDYNPYYALTRTAPHWRYPKLYTSASLSFSREVTQPDGRNRPDEIWLSDTKLTLGTPGWTIPVVDITVGGRLTSVFATSPASQAQTLTYGLDSAISINRTFSVLGGLGLGYGGSFRVNVHEFTTGELESPRIPTCRGQTCAELLGTGVRNTQYQQAHTVNMSLTILSRLSVSTSLGSISAICIPKHPLMGSAQIPWSLRTLVCGELRLGLGVSPYRGISTPSSFDVQSQRTPDNQYYNPYLNRFSQVYLDLRLTPGAWF